MRDTVSETSALRAARARVLLAEESESAMMWCSWTLVCTSRSSLPRMSFQWASASLTRRYVLRSRLGCSEAKRPVWNAARAMAGSLSKVAFCAASLASAFVALESALIVSEALTLVVWHSARGVS